MPSPPAVSLVAALLALWGAGSAQAIAAPSNPQSALPAVCPTDFVFVIARPEASDTFLPCKVRISAAEILQRNPELIRGNSNTRAYDPGAAIKLAWRSVNHVDPPPARRNRREYLSAASTGAAFLALSSLLLLCRRRMFVLDGISAPRQGAVFHRLARISVKRHHDRIRSHVAGP